MIGHNCFSFLKVIYIEAHSTLFLFELFNLYLRKRRVYMPQNFSRTNRNLSRGGCKQVLACYYIPKSLSQIISRILCIIYPALVIYSDLFLTFIILNIRRSYRTYILSKKKGKTSTRVCKISQFENRRTYFNDLNKLIIKRIFSQIICQRLAS